MLKPESESELRGIVAEASGPLRVMGGGTRPLGAPVEGEKLTTSDIQGIELHEPDALTMVARAGTAVADIEKALSMERQRLAFEPI
ncbi:MAG: FAD-binding protein, partial [Roseovarius sp.]|nr:FAD-binding protein [Roseovarius sp.]